MEKSEFDKFADEYQNLHQNNIRISGESPDFFAEYKIVDVAQLALEHFGREDLRVLDFGAGVGNSVPYFRKHLPDAKLTCLDVSARSIAIAEERFPGQADFVSFDGYEMPFSDGQFDLIFSACVFHHIAHSEHERILCGLSKILRPGGVLVIYEHNPYNPLTVRAVNTCAFDENAVLISAQVMTKILRKVGFQKVRRCYRIFFPGFFSLLRGLERYLRGFPLGAQYYVAAYKD